MSCPINMFHLISTQPARLPSLKKNQLSRLRSKGLLLAAVEISDADEYFIS